MAELDDAAITVTLPPDDDGATIIKIEGDGGKKAVADDPISDLKGQFETLKGTTQNLTQQLADRDQRLAAKDQEIATARKEVVTSQLDTVTSGLQAAEAEAEAAVAAHVAASEAGDFVAQARALRKISAAETKIGRLREAESDLKETKERAPVRQQETHQRPNADPVEAFAKNMSPKSAAWIRSHPDCVTNPKLNSRMLAAHNLAMADDIPVDSDEYFQRIEAGIKPAAAQKTETEKPAVQIRPSAPAAPGGHVGGGMNGGGATVTLSLREKTAAEDGTHLWERDSADGKHKKGTPLGVQEFARRKVIMMRQGLYDRTFNES